MAFLGKLFKGVGKAVKGVGKGVNKMAKPMGKKKGGVGPSDEMMSKLSAPRGRMAMRK